MTERFSTKKLVLSALFAALACVATMSIRIPGSRHRLLHGGSAGRLFYLCPHHFCH